MQSSVCHSPAICLRRSGKLKQSFLWLAQCLQHNHQVGRPPQVVLVFGYGPQNCCKQAFVVFFISRWMHSTTVDRKGSPLQARPTSFCHYMLRLLVVFSIKPFLYSVNICTFSQKLYKLMQSDSGTCHKQINAGSALRRCRAVHTAMFFRWICTDLCFITQGFCFLVFLVAHKQFVVFLISKTGWSFKSGDLFIPPCFTFHTWSTFLKCCV